MPVRFVRPPVASRRCAPPFLTLAALVATLAAPGYGAFARDDVPPLRDRIGDIAVVGTRFEADGRPWAPHGLNSFTFIAAPAVRGGLFRAAHDAYDTRRVAAMKSPAQSTSAEKLS